MTLTEAVFKKIVAFIRMFREEKGRYPTAEELEKMKRELKEKLENKKKKSIKFQFRHWA